MKRFRALMPVLLWFTVAGGLSITRAFDDNSFLAAGWGLVAGVALASLLIEWWDRA